MKKKKNYKYILNYTFDDTLPTQSSFALWISLQSHV